MTENEAKVEIYKLSVKENLFTLLAAVVCVGSVALITGSAHSLWGLLILMNLNAMKIKENNENS